MWDACHAGSGPWAENAADIAVQASRCASATGKMVSYLHKMTVRQDDGMWPSPLAAWGRLCLTTKAYPPAPQSTASTLG